MRRALAALALLAACGGAAPHPGHGAGAPDDDTGDDASPFVDATYTPTSFVDHVTGHGRPVIFIPGLACPGEVWDGVVAKLGDGIEAHVLTLAGFAGEKPIKPPLAAKVRRDLVRYIHSRKLDHPIVIGHSMGGFIAYWLAITAPRLIGGVVVVDSGPALEDTDVETANELRNTWAQAGDQELPQLLHAAYTSMVGDAKEIEPFLPAITRSDRQTIGDAIYELVRTDLRAQVGKITAPLLLVLSQGYYGTLYKSEAAGVPDHQVVIVPGTHHFVFLDDPDAFVKLVRKFIADHPPPR